MDPRTRNRLLAGWFKSFQKYRSLLRRYIVAHSALAEDEVDDVAQEVFLRLLRYGKAEEIVDPQSYLLRMATNVANEWKMRARYRHPHDAIGLEEIQAPQTLEPAIDAESTSRSMSRAIGRLPFRQQQILRLHYGSGLARDEIAKQLRISERMVKRDLTHAYVTLRLSLPKDVADRSEAGGA